MSTKSTFFNGVEYDATDVNRRFGMLFSNGIIPENGEIYENLRVIHKTGLTLTVLPGAYHIQGATIEVTEDGEDVTLAAADPNLPRYDAVVVEYNLSTAVNSVRLTSVTGTPASSPTPPALTRTPTRWQCRLADVFVGAGVTTISVINDRRSGEICTMAAGLPELDFTDVGAFPLKGVIESSAGSTNWNSLITPGQAQSFTSQAAYEGCDGTPFKQGLSASTTRGAAVIVGKYGNALVQIAIMGALGELFIRARPGGSTSWNGWRAIPVTGTTGVLPISSGGTGANSAAGALSSLGAAPEEHSHDRISKIVDGVLRSLLLSTTGGVIPSTDNFSNLGSVSYRFKALYATDSTIHTSDGREKKDIAAIPQAADFIAALEPVAYRWKDSAMGERVHYGFIAQQVQSAMAAAGITDFAGLVRSPLDDSAEHSDTAPEDQVRYALRYEELIAPLVATVQALTKRVEELEARAEVK